MASCFINEFLQQFPFRVITLGDGGVHFQKQLARGGGGGRVGRHHSVATEKQVPFGCLSLDAKETSAARIISCLKLSAKMSPGVKRALLGKKFVSMLSTMPHGGGKKKAKKKAVALIALQVSGDCVTQQMPRQSCAF